MIDLPMNWGEGNLIYISDPNPQSPKSMAYGGIGPYA